MHGSYHAEVNSTTVHDLTVLSVSNLLLSAMVGSYHVCVNLSSHGICVYNEEHLTFSTVSLEPPCNRQNIFKIFKGVQST